jgi:predicted phosphodiesterase
MRLAVIADIHGNLPALEAVLADIAPRGVDRIINLGDCVSGPLWPRETMELLDARGIPGVRGNHDRWLAETPRARMYPSDAFAFDRLTAAQVGALGALPPRIDLGDGVVGVHGTPRDDNEYLLEDIIDGRLAPAPPAAVVDRLGTLQAGLVLCAHSHQPRLVQARGGLQVLNPGSVGCPGYVDPTPPAHVSEAGSPHARYALLTRLEARWTVEFIAAAYDWDAASKRAAENGRDEWARALATGFVR